DVEALPGPDVMPAPVSGPGYARIEEGGGMKAEDNLREADFPQPNLSEAEPPKTEPSEAEASQAEASRAEATVSQARRRDEAPPGRMQEVRLAVQPWGEIY